MALMDNLPQTLMNLWNGNTPLWVAFWVYGQGVYALILAAYLGMYKFAFDMLGDIPARLAKDTSPLATALKVAGTVVNVADALALLVITVFFTVAIWRCAPNTEYALATYAARGVMMAFWAFVVLGGVWLYQQRGGV